MPLSPFCVLHLLQGMGSTQWDFIGDLGPLLSALGPYLVQTHAGPVHAAHSIHEFICALVLLRLEGLVLLGVLHPYWLLTTFPSLLSWDFLIPEGRDLVKASHLGLSLPRFPTLCTLKKTSRVLKISSSVWIRHKSTCHKEDQDA